MFKIIFILLIPFVVSCGVKNDVIPPEEPWAIFEYSKNKKKNVTKKKEEAKKKSAKENK